MLCNYISSGVQSWDLHEPQHPLPLPRTTRQQPSLACEMVQLTNCPSSQTESKRDEAETPALGRGQSRALLEKQLMEVFEK